MKHAYSAKYLDPTGSLWDLIIRVLRFVDNNNLSNTNEKYETIWDILKKTLDDAQFWNNPITSSGVCLELAKCFTQIIQFEFTLRGAPVISAPEEGINFTLINGILDFEFPIDPISPYDTYKNLGTVQGINKKQEDQVKVLMKRLKYTLVLLYILLLLKDKHGFITKCVSFLPLDTHFQFII